MKFQIEAVSDIGCLRKNNQDMVLIGNHLLRDGRKEIEIEFEDDHHKFMLAVADGMGGHKGGEYASHFVLDQIRKRVYELRLGLTVEEATEILNRWFQEIHQLLVYHGLTHPQAQGLGTTFVGLFFYEGKVFLLNIGDSRCYRFRHDFLVQLTKDHSLKEAMRDDNIPDNIIVNALGGSQEVFLDLEEISERILEEDFFLLCSDGLTGELSDDEIEQQLLIDTPYVSLLAAAQNSGGKDNISFLIAKRS